MRNSIVFRNSASADRSGMTASRFIVAAAACVILLYFGVESRKSQQNGAVKRRNGVLAAIFSNFGRNYFHFKIPFIKGFKIVVCLLWRRDPVLELQIVTIVCCHSIVFRNSVSADRIGMVA